MFGQESGPQREAPIAESIEVGTEACPIQLGFGQGKYLGNPRHPTGELGSVEGVNERPLPVAHPELHTAATNGSNPEEPGRCDSNDSEPVGPILSRNPARRCHDVVHSARLREETFELSGRCESKVVRVDKSTSDTERVGVREGVWPVSTGVQ